MASRTIDNIVTDENMQLDKVIDNYFDIDNYNCHSLNSVHILSVVFTFSKLLQLDLQHDLFAYM